MTTVAGHHASLAAEIRPIVARYLEGPVPEALLRDLAGFTSGYAARQVEEHARPYPWPPPRRLRVDEGAARRQQRQETRESA